MDDQLTELTELHQKLSKKLERMGFEIMEEVSFPPYTVDIYIPNLHVAFEADGPQHSKSKDAKRDAYLMDVYNLPVCRFTEKGINNVLFFRQQTLEFLQDWQGTAGLRFLHVQDKLPWL